MGHLDVVVWVGFMAIWGLTCEKPWFSVDKNGRASLDAHRTTPAYRR